MAKLPSTDSQQSIRPSVVCLLGPDDQRKNTLLSQLCQQLTSQHRKAKIMYLPKYSGQDSASAANLQAQLACQYVADGYVCLVNVAMPVPALTPYLEVEISDWAKKPDKAIIQHVLAKLSPKPKDSRQTIPSLDYPSYGGQFSWQKQAWVPPEFNPQLAKEYTDFVWQVSQQAEIIKDRLGYSMPELYPLGRAINIQNRQPQARPKLKSALQALADQLPLVTEESSTLQLVSYWPRNEMDVSAYSLFSYSDLPISIISQETRSWPYKKKAKILHQRQATPAIYIFEAIASSVVLADIVGQIGAECVIGRQLVSPRLGFEVPQAIDHHGLAELYEQCFDEALGLHSAIQADCGTELAQLACLHGHKARFLLRLTHPQTQKLRAAKLQRPETKAILAQLSKALAEVHPLISSAT